MLHYDGKLELRAEVPVNLLKRTEIEEFQTFASLQANLTNTTKKKPLLLNNRPQPNPQLEPKDTLGTHVQEHDKEQILNKKQNEQVQQKLEQELEQEQQSMDIKIKKINQSLLQPTQSVIKSQSEPSLLHVNNNADDDDDDDNDIYERPDKIEPVQIRCQRNHISNDVNGDIDYKYQDTNHDEVVIDTHNQVDNTNSNMTDDNDSTNDLKNQEGNYVCVMDALNPTDELGNNCNNNIYNQSYEQPVLKTLTRSNSFDHYDDLIETPLLADIYTLLNVDINRKTNFRKSSSVSQLTNSTRENLIGDSENTFSSNSVGSSNSNNSNFGSSTSNSNRSSLGRESCTSCDDSNNKINTKSLAIGSPTTRINTKKLKRNSSIPELPPREWGSESFAKTAEQIKTKSNSRPSSMASNGKLNITLWAKDDQQSQQRHQRLMSFQSEPNLSYQSFIGGEHPSKRNRAGTNENDNYRNNNDSNSSKDNNRNINNYHNVINKNNNIDVNNKETKHTVHFETTLGKSKQYSFNDAEDNTCTNTNLKEQEKSATPLVKVTKFFNALKATRSNEENNIININGNERENKYLSDKSDSETEANLMSSNSIVRK
eukprot:Pgem_evm1s7470